MNDAGDPLLQVNVQLTEADLQALLAYSTSKHGLENRPGFQVAMLLVALPSFPLLPYLVAATWPATEAWIAAALLLAVGVMSMPKVVGVQRRAWKKWIRSVDARWHLQPRQVQLTPTHVHAVSPLSDNKYAWCVITSIERHSQHLYIHIGYGQVFIIPDRAFSDDHVRDHFQEMAEQFRSTSIGNQLACPACGYDLRGNAPAGCPECGWGRHAEESATTSAST